MTNHFNLECVTFFCWDGQVAEAQAIAAALEEDGPEATAAGDEGGAAEGSAKEGGEEETLELDPEVNPDEVAGDDGDGDGEHAAGDGDGAQQSGDADDSGQWVSI